MRDEGGRIRGLSDGKWRIVGTKTSVSIRREVPLGMSIHCVLLLCGSSVFCVLFLLMSCLINHHPITKSLMVL
jgi:hypothetical protein